MTQLRRAIGGEHHLFIMAGPSIGTRQISDSGIAWLKKQKYTFPQPGGWLQLNLSDYRYLERQGYLYTKGEEHAKFTTQPLSIPLAPPETAHYGPPLLLQLADNYQNAQNLDQWRLLLKLDEWEATARDILIRERAAAVGCYTSSETGKNFFSSISLQHINKADYWPDVAPRSGNYELYWQKKEASQEKSQLATRLNEATPTPGLQTRWQGNVFFKFTACGLPNAWKRYLPGMSNSERNAEELYWLAQSDLKPDPPWPGKAQRVGQPNRDWQLWHLQMEPETKEECAEWLWYRQIDVRPPAWHLRLLNPLSHVSELHEYTCPPGQPLLVRCDPPVQHQQNGPSKATLALMPYTQGVVPRRPLLGGPVRSQPLTSHAESYLCASAPLAHQEYRISLDGGAKGLSLWVETASCPTKQPTWLHGLRCSLTIAGKKYREEKAFWDEPSAETHAYPAYKDFTLEQLAQATWSYQPSDIPCSLHWEYQTAQGKHCRETRASISSDSALTNWWQSHIWPAVAESLWVELTLDAASFGKITLRLILTDPQIKVWWEYPEYIAAFCWLSRMAEQDTIGAQQATSPELSQALARLCVSDLPPTLRNALTQLATSRDLPIWISLRLQVLLADLYSTFKLITQEG